MGPSVFHGPNQKTQSYFHRLSKPHPEIAAKSGKKIHEQKLRHAEGPPGREKNNEQQLRHAEGPPGRKKNNEQKLRQAKAHQGKTRKSNLEPSKLGNHCGPLVPDGFATPSWLFRRGAVLLTYVSIRKTNISLPVAPPTGAPGMRRGALACARCTFVLRMVLSPQRGAPFPYLRGHEHHLGSAKLSSRLSTVRILKNELLPARGAHFYAYL